MIKEYTIDLSWLFFIPLGLILGPHIDIVWWEITLAFVLFRLAFFAGPYWNIKRRKKFRR